MNVALLAGGLGTRIQQYYPNTIKSLIEFRGVPFIFYQLDLLRKNGLTDVVICTGNGAQNLINALTSSKMDEYSDMNIHLSFDGVKPLGTGGAVKKAFSFLTDSFMVLYGDSYLDTNYKTIINKFEKSNKLGLMSIYRNKNRYDKSNVKVFEDLVIEYWKECPDCDYIDYGLNIFKKEAFNNTPLRFDLSYVQENLVEKGEMGYHIIKNRFYEIGSIEGINDFEEMIRKKDVYS